MNDVQTAPHTALNWLQRLRETVSQGDANAHLALASTALRVYPGAQRKALDYTDWAHRRRDDIEQGRLTALTHTPPRFRTLALRRIVLHVEETLHFDNGRHEIQSKELILEKEPDEHWRLVEEQIKARRDTTRQP